MNEKISGEAISIIMKKIKEGNAEMGDFLELYGASEQHGSEFLPPLLTESIEGVFMSERDFMNGGADQFVWNHGSEAAKEIGQNWRKLGAIENGELLLRLSEALDSYRAEFNNIEEKSVEHFLQFRKYVKGPFFGIPEPVEEVSEAAIEWAIEHFDKFSFSEEQLS